MKIFGRQNIGKHLIMFASRHGEMGMDIAIVRTHVWSKMSKMRRNGNENIGKRQNANCTQQALKTWWVLLLKRRKFKSFTIVIAVLMGNYYWSRDRTDLSLWRHRFYVCCQAPNGDVIGFVCAAQMCIMTSLMLYVLPKGTVGPLGNTHINISNTWPDLKLYGRNRWTLTRDTP